MQREFQYGADGGATQLTEIPSQEPKNLFYPLFLRRPPVYNEIINEQAGYQITENWQSLPGRLDRLMDSTNPVSADLAKAMYDIVGVKVTAVQSSNGKKPGAYVEGTARTYIERMGAGVANAVTLLSCLIDARRKVFLIEEPETDLHPGALKELLKVIEAGSDQNQFFISTHSHIVVRYLCNSNDRKLFHVTTESNPRQLFTSVVVEVHPVQESRREILNDLGYELVDFDLFDSWLFLEEASLEWLVREHEHLVRWFAPKLIGRLRTVAARGVGEVSALFDDFRRLFLFAHLEGRYGKRAWVAVDAGTEGDTIIANLRKTFRQSWPESHFRTWQVKDCEYFYPQEFDDQVKAALSLPHDQKPAAKESLRQDLACWIVGDNERARAGFEKSAGEVIALLQDIERAVVQAPVSRSAD